MTTIEILTEYIIYLESKLDRQSDELSNLYAFCDDPQDETRMNALSDISTAHDTYILDSHFAEVIEEMAKIKAGTLNDNDEPQAPELTEEQVAATKGNEHITELTCGHYATCRWDMSNAINEICDECCHYKPLDAHNDNG